jgi:hypothetical protein
MIAPQIGRARQRTHQCGQVPRPPKLFLISRRVSGAHVIRHDNTLSRSQPAPMAVSAVSGQTDYASQIDPYGPRIEPVFRHA